MSTVTVKNLGACAVSTAVAEVTPDSPLLFFVLLFICEEQSRSILRSELLEVAFPESMNSREASHNLRQLLYRIKKLGVPITMSGRAVSIDVNNVDSTLHEFIRSSPDSRVERLARSIAILPGYCCTQPVAKGWLDALRDRAHAALRRQLNEDLYLFRQRADWRSVESIARRLLEIDPLSESATLGLAEAVALTGSKTLALNILQHYECELGDSRTVLALPSQVLRRRISNSTPHRIKSHLRPLALVGRFDEVGVLTASWQKSRDSNFGITIVTGDKAVGKTRVLEELSAMVTLDGTGVVVQYCAEERDKGRPLSLFTDLVRQFLLLPGAAGCDPAALPVLRRLTDTAPPHGRLGATLGQPLYDDAGVRNAIADLLASVASERCIMCIIDDAHHIDKASLVMLDGIQQRHPSLPVLIILAGRTQGSDVMRSRFLLDTWVRLQPLSHAESRALLTSLCRTANRSLTEAQVEWILEVAAGNPGHLELLIASSSLSASTSSVPADIIALTDERILSLSARAQHCLQAISLIGEGTVASTVSRLTGLADYSLLTALDELDRSALIQSTVGGMQCRSSFVAERSLYAASSPVVGLMHERAALLLEERQATESLSASLAWRITNHWKAAGQSERARDFMRVCWQHAINIGQPMVACEAIRSEIASAQSNGDRARLQDDLIGALQAAGELRDVHKTIAERQTLSDIVGDTHLVRASLAFDRLEAEVLDYSIPASHLDALLRHVRSVDLDTHRRLRAARLLMMAADVLIDAPLASSVYDLGDSLVATDTVSELHRRHISLIFHTVFGDPNSALTIASGIDSIAAEGERSWSKFVSHRNCSLARQLVGPDNADYTELERDYSECLDASMSMTALQCAAHLASILIDDGDIARAQEWMLKAEKLIGSRELRDNPVDYLSGQVDLALLAGDERRARHFLARMHENAHRYRFGRLRNDLFLYRLRVDQVCSGAAISSHDLAELLRFHELARSFGRHDDHMEVLWVALVSHGRATEASVLLAEYLRTHRRERRSCRHLLKTRTQVDPAWQLYRLHSLATRRE